MLLKINVVCFSQSAQIFSHSVISIMYSILAGLWKFTYVIFVHPFVMMYSTDVLSDQASLRCSFQRKERLLISIGYVHNV